MKGPRLALLVDAENVNPKQAEFALKDAQARGRVIVRRAFGDFFRPNLSGWKAFLTEHAFAAEMALSAITKKDTADLLLAQHATRLAERDAVDVIALVSSDSDFGAIARGIAESGVPVIGYGRKGVPESWVRACSEFVTFPDEPKPAPGASVGADDVKKNRDRLLSMMQEGRDENGWIRLATIGSRLSKKVGPDYKKQLGVKALSDLPKKFPKDFEVERREGDGATPALFIRRRKG